MAKTLRRISFLAFLLLLLVCSPYVWADGDGMTVRISEMFTPL